MALNIKSQQVESLAAEVARLARETKATDNWQLATGN